MWLVTQAETGLTASASREHQGGLATTQSPERHKQLFPQGIQQKPTWLAPPGFGLLASRTLREESSVVFSHSLCGALLWQARKLTHILLQGNFHPMDTYLAILTMWTDSTPFQNQS